MSRHLVLAVVGVACLALSQSCLGQINYYESKYNFLKGVTLAPTATIGNRHSITH